MYLPILTLRTSGIPRCRIASRTALPCGSSTAAFGITMIFTFIAPPYLQLTVEQVQIGDLSLLPTLRLSNNVAGLFILAQAQEHGRTQFSVTGPLGEFDFANEHRIYPMDFAHHGRRDSLNPLPVLFRWQIDKGTPVARFFLEFLVRHR